MPEEFRTDFPMKEGGKMKCLGGFDLLRSAKLHMAIIAVEYEDGRRDIRFYRWQLRIDRAVGGQVWKVDLARFSVRRFNFEDIAKKVSELRVKFGIAG
jgi:hypothetical protein